MQIVHIHAGIKEQTSAEIVGSKAANLARMAMLGLPVPAAFVIPIELCGAIVDGDTITVFRIPCRVLYALVLQLRLGAITRRPGRRATR